MSHKINKKTVWCAFWSRGVIGPSSFKNGNGRAVTVNGERYRTMSADYFWDQIEGIDVDNVYFQQDGAPCHIASAKIVLVEEKFGEHLISKIASIPWPPRACDLAPLDYFLWGYVKSLVYANDPQTIDALKTKITNTICQITPDLCEKVMKNWV